MKASSKIIFFGNERLSTGFTPHGAPTLEALIRNGYEVVAVVASFERGVSRSARKLEVAEVAAKHSIPVFVPQKPADIVDELRAFGAAAAVLVAYGRIIPQSVIDIFPRGIINIHPSLLPLYRGTIPIEQAILDGAKQTGVSLMQLVAAMDAGPVYAQKTIELDGTETKQALTERLLNLGGELLINHLPAIVDGTAQPTTQDEHRATYTTKLAKDDGVMDLSKPAHQLERQVRAFAGWPKSRLQAFGHTVVVNQARIAAHAQDGDFVLACGGNTFLEIITLTAPSGRSMSGAAFLHGYGPKQ